MQTVNQRLKIIREELRLNQSEFADSLEIKQSYLSVLEKGKKDVTFKLCTRLSEKHGISMDWFVTGKGSIKSEETVKSTNASLEGNPNKSFCAFEDLEKLFNKNTYMLIKLSDI